MIEKESVIWQVARPFLFCSLLISGIYALFAYVLRKSEKLEVVSVDEDVGFIPIRRSSPVALKIDPRAEEEIYDDFGSR